MAEREIITDVSSKRLRDNELGNLDASITPLATRYARWTNRHARLLSAVTTRAEQDEVNALMVRMKAELQTELDK